MNLYVLTTLTIAFFVSKLTIEVSSLATAVGRNVQEYQDHCRFTQAHRGSKRNRRCKFPFVFGDKKYTTCTDAKDPDGEFWCSTRVNPRTRAHIGGKGHWGYCQPGCEDEPREDFIPLEFETKLDQDAEEEENEPEEIVQGKVCSGRRFPENYWDQTRTELSLLENKTNIDDWTHFDTQRGDYLPNEYDGTCGESIKFGFIVCAKGQDCDAKFGAYPFIAALGYRRKAKGKPITRYACGGTLINRRYVITAAHCHDITKASKRISEVVLGDYDLSKNPDCLPGAPQSDGCWKPKQKFYITPSDVTVHEKFESLKVVNEGYDIALVRLPRAAYTVNEICETSVLPACLPWGQLPNGQFANLPLGNDEYTVMGWGRSNNDRRSQGDKDEGGAFKNVLQKLSVPHIENSWCKSNPQWKAFSKITTDRQLCAGGRIHEDSCSGDSGGPLISQLDESSKMYLRGIVSFGTRRCGKGFPGVYTDITYYIDWIKNHMEP